MIDSKYYFNSGDDSAQEEIEKAMRAPKIGSYAAVVGTALAFLVVAYNVAKGVRNYFKSPKPVTAPTTSNTNKVNAIDFYSASHVLREHQR